MELNEYQERAMDTCLPESHNELYMLHELCEEVGELHGKFAKAIRKGYITSNDNNFIALKMTDEGSIVFEQELMKEVGDIMWGIAGFCDVMGWPLEQVCQLNLDKLADRKRRGVIDSKGDNR